MNGSEDERANGNIKKSFARNAVGFKHLLAALALCMMALLLMPIPVYAAIPQPTVFSIDSVHAYRHCLETGDQLYVGMYSVSCNTTYSITEAFLARLMDGAAELKAVAPYAYYNSGYGEGGFSLYFSAAEAPPWSGAYTMTFEGNPTLTWAGGAPPWTSLAGFDSWSASSGIEETQTELASRVLWMADHLEQEWGINLIDTVGTGSVLSAYGVDYFNNVIQNLQSMAPSAFTGSSVAPDWERKEYTQAYGTSLAASVAGTPFDLSPLAAVLGISTMWLSTVCYMAGGAVMIFFALMPLGNTRPLILLCVPLLAGGALLGMMPLIFVIMMALAAWVLSIFVIFYSSSTA